jgi:hypothetical protein
MNKIWFPKDELDRMNAVVDPLVFEAYRNEYYVKVFIAEENGKILAMREMEYLTNTGLHKVIGVMLADMKKELDYQQRLDRLANRALEGGLGLK